MPEAPSPWTPVGPQEIATVFGVKVDTVQKWRRRHPEFPQPRWKVHGRPTWVLSEIRAWHRARIDGRVRAQPVRERLDAALLAQRDAAARETMLACQHPPDVRQVVMGKILCAECGVTLLS